MYESLSQLTKLSLSGDASIPCTAALPELRHLDLYKHKSVEASSIGRFTQLTMLEITSCKLDAAALHAIAEVRSVPLSASVSERKRHS
jgi:hypothetical protein